MIQFGWWREHDGRRGSLEYDPDTGILRYWRPSPGEIISRVGDTTRLRIYLEGWTEHTEEGIDWVKHRLQGRSS